MSSKPKDNWASGDLYEPYVGRWSRLVAREFLNWLSVPKGSKWLDVGCGTGALSQTILQLAEPVYVKGIDRSEEFVAYASAHTPDQRAQFEVGDAQKLNVESESFDVAVSALVINFIPQPELAIAEMSRATKKDGVVAAYVWDYAKGMQLMRYFWDAVIALDSNASNIDESLRFPLCQPDALRQLFESANLKNIEVRGIEVPTHFRNFDDYWSPFLGGQGPAPSHAMSLTEQDRIALRERIRANLPIESDSSIKLTAKAWAIRGIK